MAIFSRRKLQRLINENAAILSEEDTLKQVEALNRSDESSLAFEWEVVLINVFSKFGKVEYEPNLGTGSRPDLKFDSPKEPLSFVADIATVSDRGYEEQNPLGAFHDEIMNRAKKYNIRLNSFSIKIGHGEDGNFKNKKIKLRIPARGKFEEFFNADFKAYLIGISKNPLEPRDFSVQTDKIVVRIKYNPNQQFANIGHASYNTPYSLTKNPVYNALKSKAEQLKRTNYAGVKAIFLCDGKCEALRNDNRGVLSKTTNGIIFDFLRQHSSINFVILFTVQKEYENPTGVGKIVVRMKFFRNTEDRRTIDFGGTILGQNLHTVFPSPDLDVLNAVIQLDKDKRRKFSPFYGGSEMTMDTIKISARGLLDLLSGKIDQKKFFEDHHFFEFIGSNYFADRLREGRLINKISLEKTEKDDDWVSIEFGEPDPAISKFTLP